MLFLIRATPRFCCGAKACPKPWRGRASSGSFALVAPRASRKEAVASPFSAQRCAHDVDQRLRFFVEPHALDAKARGRFAVAVPVADEEALAAIDIEIAGGLREQAGLRLAAVASHTVACDERLRVVWTVIESVDTRALGGKPRRELVVETPDVVFAVKPARNTRLVGHDKHQVSGIVQEPHCFACTRDDIELIDPVDVAVIDVEDAVAIEERGG